jgi:hypothetical protein
VIFLPVMATVIVGSDAADGAGSSGRSARPAVLAASETLPGTASDSPAAKMAALALMEPMRFKFPPGMP